MRPKRRVRSVSRAARSEPLTVTTEGSTVMKGTTVPVPGRTWPAVVLRARDADSLPHGVRGVAHPLAGRQNPARALADRPMHRHGGAMRIRRVFVAAVLLGGVVPSTA